MKQFFFIILLLFLSCDDSSNKTCEEAGGILDDCGICDGTCEFDNQESCDYIYECGKCYDNYDLCYGCTDPDALNISSFATIEDNSCVYFGYRTIDLKFFTEEMCNPVEDTDDCSGYFSIDYAESCDNDVNCTFNILYKFETK